MKQLFIDDHGVQQIHNLTRKLHPLEKYLVLLDLMMPVMDGFRFAELVRQNPAYSAVPILVLTAKELTAEDRQQLEHLVEQIIRKGELSKDDLLLQLRGTVDKALNPS